MRKSTYGKATVLILTCSVAAWAQTRPPAIRLTIDEVPILSLAAPSADFSDFPNISPTIDTARESVSSWIVAPGFSGYALARSDLDGDRLPAAETVRVGDFMNAAESAGPEQAGDGPVLRLAAEAFPSPTRPGHHVLHVTLEARPLEPRSHRSTGFVAVVHSSESGLGAVQAALEVLVDHLDQRDRLGFVAYAGRRRVVLEPESMAHRSELKTALGNLGPSNSSDLEGDLLRAYEMMALHRNPYRSHQVLLFSDGVPDLRRDDRRERLLGLARRQARQGVPLSVVSLGAARESAFLSQLAASGDGHSFYADHAAEARRLASQELPRLPDLVARDVRAQVAFDRLGVAHYRYLGPPGHQLSPELFTEASANGGELSAGQCAAAVYEVRLTSRAVSGSAPLGEVRVRYATPEGERRHLELALVSSAAGSSRAARTWIAAAFAEKLADSFWARDTSYRRLLEALGRLDPEVRTHPATAELAYLLRKAARLDRRLDLDADRLSTDRFARLRILE